MKVYTKTGDKGFTSLATGTRVAKQHERIEAYGTVDELNSYIGLLRDSLELEKYREELLAVQNCLFVIGSNLASDEKETKVQIPQVELSDIELLEHGIDYMDQQLEPLRFFVLPGGHAIISFCQIARAVCRRAERRAYSLAENSAVPEQVLVYLNRLSDYLFTLARMLNRDFNVEEIPWKSK